jgi:hypothetical protein
MNQELVKFYTSGGRDGADRSLFDILAMDDWELERTHDFIQWIFPTETQSAYNSDAPLLDLETQKVLLENPVFEARFKKAIKRMLVFWGLDYREGKSYIQILPITEKLFWMEYDNHNLLRMTRFMESCQMLGRGFEARNLFEVLLQASKNPDWHFVALENVTYWYSAAFGKTL